MLTIQPLTDLRPVEVTTGIALTQFQLKLLQNAVKI